MSYVYVLSNPAMPGLVKIGYTDGAVPERARDLSAATGVPAPFFVEKIWEEENASILEEMVHRELSAFRVNPNREFFRTSPSDADDAIKRIAGSKEFWRTTFMRLWNRAPNEWREHFIEYVQSPVFDSSRAA